MEWHLSHDRRQAAHRDRYEPPEHPPNTLLLAYEDRRYEKMARELKDSENELKLKILHELNEDYKQANKIVLSVMTSDIMKVLVHHLKDQDDQIREFASRALVQICKVVKTREIFMINDYAHNIRDIISDPVDQIRRNAYNAMLNLTFIPEGSLLQIDMNMQKILVDKLVDEEVEDILCQIHELIKRQLYEAGGTEKALETQAISRICDFLTSQNVQLRNYAITNLYCISFNEDGKNKELKEGCVQKLAELLRDGELQIRTSTVLALNSQAQLNDGKHQLIDNGYMEIVQQLMRDETELEIQLNLVQLITSLAEAPKGRIKGFEILDRLEELKNGENKATIGKYAQDAIDVITWKP